MGSLQKEKNCVMQSSSLQALQDRVQTDPLRADTYFSKFKACFAAAWVTTSEPPASCTTKLP